MKLTSTPLNFLVLFILSLCGACTKSSVEKPAIAELITQDVINESATGAWTGGTIINSTGNFSAYGVCYSATNAEPTINDSKTAEVINVLSFNSNIKGLTPNTTYYVRAYATNSSGTGYGNVIQFKTPADFNTIYGEVSTFGPALFNHPGGLATDGAGNVYVADSYNNIIRKITAAGDVSTVAGNGTVGYINGPSASAEFYAPAGLAIDIYVADMGNNIIRKISAAGVVSTFAGTGNPGYANGAGTAAQFKSPAGLAIDNNGNLYVADNGNNAVRKITPAGVVTTVAGNGTAGYINAQGTSAYLNKPTGIAIDGAGNLYVAEPDSKVIRKINTDNRVTTFIGGPGSVALAIGKPQDIHIDAQNNFYITDGTGRVFKIDAAKNLKVLAGKSGTTGQADGNGSVALFNYPGAITTDNEGNVFIADVNNNKIRKIRQQ
jgi:sugar lactone lactonase YvrE